MKRINVTLWNIGNAGFGAVQNILSRLTIKSSLAPTKAAQRDTFLEVHYSGQGSRTLQLLFEQSEI